MFHPGLPDKIVNISSILLSKMINRGKDLRTMDFSNILCIRQDEIGDMCYSLHIFKLLRERYPLAKITVLCKPAASGIIKNDPNINLIVTDVKQLKGKFDLTVDLRGRWTGVLYSLFHPSKVRLERGSVRLKNKLAKGQPHEAVTNFEIIQPLFRNPDMKMPLPVITSSQDEIAAAEKFISDNGLKRFAIMHTQVKRELRQWPGERFAATAALLKNEYGLDIVFCGDKTEVEGITSIQKQIAFPTYSVAGVLNLGAFAALSRKATFFIGNDSSPLHIATLSGVPSLGLFGPGQSDTFFPITENSGYLHHLLPCNPCHQIKCVHPDNPCIKRITIEEVKEKIATLLV